MHIVIHSGNLWSKNKIIIRPLNLGEIVFKIDNKRKFLTKTGVGYIFVDLKTL